MKCLGLISIFLLVIAGLSAQTATAPAAGNGTETNPYQIANLENLFWIAADNDVVPDPDRNTRWSSHYIQTADIDASDTENWFDGAGWKPVGYSAYMDSSPFSGSYNGNGFVIDSLHIQRPESNMIGLFGYASIFARLENIGLSNVSIEGNSLVGSLAGSYGIIMWPGNLTELTETAGLRNEPGIYSCWSTGVVIGGHNVGGLTGRVSSAHPATAVIDNCCGKAQVYGINHVGGLIGYSHYNVSISDSYASGPVTGQNHIGGLVGRTWYTTLENIGSSGTVQGSDNTGGLIGNNSDSEVTSGHFTGNVFGNDKVGSLIGLNNASTVRKCYSTGSASGLNRVGGLIGENANGSLIEKSYFTGLVSGETATGGIVGFNNNSSVRNSFNRGIITGSVMIGGLIGSSTGSGTILNNYSAGGVQGNSLTGGLIGSCWDTTVSGSYWDIIASGQQNSDGGEGRTTEEMTYPYSPDTFLDWDFQDIWIADEDHSINDGYPFLRYLEHPVSVEDNLVVIPQDHINLSNYPNPFNPETTIVFNLPADTERLKLRIYNIRGQLVRTLISSAPFSAGEHQIVWDGRDDGGKLTTSGLYFYRLTTPGCSQVRRMLLLK